MIKIVKNTSIALFFMPFVLMAQTSQVNIDPKANETIKIEAEKALSVSVGLSNIESLKFQDAQVFTDESTLTVGFQQFLSNQISVDVGMSFAFNSRGEQSYYTGSVLGTYHRPLYKDILNLRAGMGVNYSQFRFSAKKSSLRERVGKNQVSWLEGVAALGLEYKLYPDISLLSGLQFRQAGFSELNDNLVEGSSFVIQPIGLNVYY